MMAQRDLPDDFPRKLEGKLLLSLISDQLLSYKVNLTTSRQAELKAGSQMWEPQMLVPRMEVIEGHWSPAKGHRSRHYHNKIWEIFYKLCRVFQTDTGLDL